MITQTINLNLIPGGVLPRINVSQYDKGSRTLNFNIYNGSVLFNIPTESTITIQGTKPDHTGFQYSCEYEGSVVTADLEQQMSAISGEVTCEVIINKDHQLIGTGNFILNVEPAAVKDDTVISETELPLIEQAIEAAAEAEASAISAAESAEEAASWSTHPPYIGENGNWYVYDPETEEFVDTGDPSRGPQGIQGETGPKGDMGVTPDITMNASVDNTSGTPAVVVTETGTDEDPVFSLAFSGLKGPQGDTGATGETGPQGPTGPTGNGISNITKTGTSGLVDTYTITYTDGTTSTFTVTNGRDGTGSGDMSMSDYDPTGSVKNDGGIPDFIADQISGKQNVILSSALPIGGVNRTTVEEALGALADETGGHSILNESDTELPQRSKLQFNGAIVSDDETNDATVVETVSPVDYEEDIYGVNLIPYPYYSPNERVTNGITFTVNADLSITANGTATADALFMCANRNPSYDFGIKLNIGTSYTLTGCPSGGSNSTYFLRSNYAVNGVAGIAGTDAGNGAEFEAIEVDNPGYGVYITIVSGTTVNNLTFKPMLYKANLKVDDYIPFNEQSIQHQLTEQTNVLGAKNLIPYPYYATSSVVYGVTWTINSDGIITASGTADSSHDSSIYLIYDSISDTFKKANLILNGCPSGGSDETYKMAFRVGNASNHAYIKHYNDMGEGVLCPPLQSGQDLRIELVVRKGKTAPSQPFKPMLRLASDPDNTYVPPAMTNRQITEAVSNTYQTVKLSESVSVTADGTTNLGGLLDRLNSALIAYLSDISSDEVCKITNLNIPNYSGTLTCRDSYYNLTNNSSVAPTFYGIAHSSNTIRNHFVLMRSSGSIAIAGNINASGSSYEVGTNTVLESGKVITVYLDRYKKI